MAGSIRWVNPVIECWAKQATTLEVLKPPGGLVGGQDRVKPVPVSDLLCYGLGM